VLDTQAKQQERKVEMGYIGRLFGSVRDKTGNIAGAAVIVGLLMIAVVFWISYFYPNSNNVPVGELMTLFGGIVSLALGYIFGKGSGHSEE
jgi:uncharacterized membrane protein